MRLIQYTPAYSQRVQNYYLTPEMQAFTGVPTEAVQLYLQDAAYHPILGLKDEELVSFFYWMKGLINSTIQVTQTLFCCGLFLPMPATPKKGMQKPCLPCYPLLCWQTLPLPTKLCWL